MTDISIKTVDGSRFDYAVPDDANPYRLDGDWLTVQLPGDCVIRKFLIRNIVCIRRRKTEA